MNNKSTELVQEYLGVPVSFEVADSDLNWEDIRPGVGGISEHSVIMTRQEISRRRRGNFWE